MKIKLYQIDLERDANHKAFRSVRSEADISRNLYDLRYSGEVPDTASLEDVFMLFNERHPADYATRSLSVSDIVEFPEKGAAYICQDFG